MNEHTVSAASHHARRITVLSLGREVSATVLPREPTRRPAPPVDDPEPSEVADLAPTEAEAAFVAWVVRCRRPDHQDPEHRTEAADHSPEHLLDAVCGSPRPLPVDAASKLGMPAGTTLGAAAAEVIDAVRDPNGPQCPSFQAALFHHFDRADLRGDEPEPRVRNEHRPQAHPEPQT